MAGLVRNDFHVMSAKNLIDAFEAGTDTFYLVLGREGSDVSGREWPNELSPPLESNTPWTYENYAFPYTAGDTEGDQFWDYTVGFVKATRLSMSLVVPNPSSDNTLTWNSVITYRDFDDTEDPAVVFAVSSVNANGNFYLVSSNNHVYEVTGSATPAVLSSEPTTPVDQSISGFSLVYKYTIGSVQASDTANFITDGWIPLNYGDSLDAGEATDVWKTFGAKYIMFSVEVPNGGLLSDTAKYRQVGIISNPVLDDGSSTLASAATYGPAVTSNGAQATDIIKRSGQFLFLDNRIPIQRVDDSTERYQIIVQL